VKEKLIFTGKTNIFHFPMLFGWFCGSKFSFWWLEIQFLLVKLTFSNGFPMVLWVDPSIPSTVASAGSASNSCRAPVALSPLERKWA